MLGRGVGIEGVNGWGQEVPSRRLNSSIGPDPPCWEAQGKSEGWVSEGEWLVGYVPVGGALQHICLA